MGEFTSLKAFQAPNKKQKLIRRYCDLFATRRFDMTIDVKYFRKNVAIKSS